MNIRLLRHATLVVEYGGIRLLVDPMLGPSGAMDPVANAANQKRIPLVDLPVTEAELLDIIRTTDGVVVTHTHRDHWDSHAIDLLPKSIPILCQPVNEESIRESGFTSVTPVVDDLEWQGVKFHRTDGQHGTGEIGLRMGLVSGFILDAPQERRLYIAGDTIWCHEVQKALQTFHPAIVVVNAGAAQFLTGDPITMTAEDVCWVATALPAAQVIAVHMETVNHCGLTRAGLREVVQQRGLADKIMIPADGERIPL